MKTGRQGIVTRSRIGLALIGTLAAILAPQSRALADPCNAAKTQADMNQCSARELESAEAQMKRRYTELMKRASEEPVRQALQASQSAWTQYRDRECALEASGVSGGSIYPTIVADCLTTMTKARKKQLERFAHCEEGDISCPF